MKKEVKTYTLICDNCGKGLFEDTEYCGFMDGVEDMADESGWWISPEGNHYCPDCWTHDDEGNEGVINCIENDN